MSFCGKCGAKIGDNDMFCAKCGASKIVSSQSVPQTQINESNERALHNCPNCGAPIKGFQSICEMCGSEFRTTNTISPVMAFSKQLEEIESQRKAPNIASVVASNLFAMNNTNKTDIVKANAISTFVIPNTKEDILEFMILASANIVPEYFANPNSNNSKGVLAEQKAWYSKMEQAYNKAKLSFSSDPVFKEVERIFIDKKHDIDKEKKKNSRGFIFAILGMVGVMILALGMIGIGRLSHNAKEKKLEQTVQEIQMDIINGDYDSALIKAQSLHMDDNYSSDSKEHWDEQREQLIELIEQKKTEEQH